MGQGDAYSVKVTNTDTLYLFQYFSQGDRLPDSTTYYAIMGKEDRIELDSLIRRISSTKLDTAALHGDASHEDSFDICLIGKNTDREFFAEGSVAPPLFKEVNYFFEKLRRKIKFTPVDTLIHFKSGHGVIYPDRIVIFKQR